MAWFLSWATVKTANVCIFNEISDMAGVLVINRDKGVSFEDLLRDRYFRYQSYYISKVNNVKRKILPSIRNLSKICQ